MLLPRRAVGSLPVLHTTYNRTVPILQQQQQQQSLAQRRWLSSSSSSSSSNDEKAREGAPATTPLRLSKWIAQQHGVSRREAERLIRAGKVVVGKQGIVTSSASTIELEDLPFVTVSSSAGAKRTSLAASRSSSSSSSSSNNSNNNVQIRTRVWLVHKLVGELVTERDPQGRDSVLDRIVRGGVGHKQGKHKQQHIKAIGRLDMNTSGLLIVTNDGHYARQMEIPANQLHRVYRARVHGRIAPYKLEAMGRPLRIAGVRYSPMRVKLLETRKRAEATNQWLEITCTEGKNRQVRNVLQNFGCA